MFIKTRRHIFATRRIIAVMPRDHGSRVVIDSGLTVDLDAEESAEIRTALCGLSRPRRPKAAQGEVVDDVHVVE